MPVRLRRYVWAALVVLPMLGLSACGGEGPTTPPPAPPPPPPPPPGAKIAFTVQPPNGELGVALAPAVQVVVQTSAGGTVPSATNHVVLDLSPNSTGAVLSGIIARNAVNGVATFNDLRLDRVGTYTLTATSTGLEGVTSASFTITVPPPPPPPANLGVGFGAEQFALIPVPGTFQMGPMTAVDVGHPFNVQSVTLTKPFMMQRSEVTQEQWRQVMGSHPSWSAECGDLCPVGAVSWLDIEEFLAKLNELDPGKGYRLPTEAEWEYAARAGTTGVYGGTGILDQMGWYRDNSQGRFWPVAQKLANAWGLYDMHGNAWEWVNDWWGFYSPDAHQTDPTGPPGGAERVLRGGGIGHDASGVRSASRSSLAPSLPWAGFRLARTP